MSAVQNDLGLQVADMGTYKQATSGWTKSNFHPDIVRFIATNRNADGRAYLTINAEEYVCVRHGLCDHCNDGGDYYEDCTEGCECTCNDDDGGNVCVTLDAQQIPQLLQELAKVLDAVGHPQIHVIQESVAAILRGEHRAY